MAVNDIYRVTAQWLDQSARVFQWVWHYQQTSGPVITDAALAAAIKSNLATAWAEIEGVVTQKVVGDTLEVALWDTLNEEFNTIYVETLDTGFDGVSTTEVMPYQDAGVVKFFTTLPRSVGKKFLFGLVETAIGSQSLQAATVTAALLFAAEFINDIVSGGATFVPGNFNRLTTAFLFYSGIVECNVLVGSQDRRRVGIGI